MVGLDSDEFRKTFCAQRRVAYISRGVRWGGETCRHPSLERQVQIRSLCRWQFGLGCRRALTVTRFWHHIRPPAGIPITLSNSGFKGLSSGEREDRSNFSL